jgi:uncharacterized protein with PIN domain
MRVITFTCDGCGASAKPKRHRYSYRSASPDEWMTVTIERPMDADAARHEINLCAACASRFMLAVSAIAGVP